MGPVNLVQEIQIFGIYRDVNLSINACVTGFFNKSLGLCCTNNIFMTGTFFFKLLMSSGSTKLL